MGLAVLAVLWPAAASAQESELLVKGKAFCNGMATAITQNKGKCPEMAKALQANLDTHRAFLKANARELETNQTLAQHCNTTMQGVMGDLGACMQGSTEVQKVLEETAKAMTPERKTYTSEALPAGANPGLTDPSKAAAKAPEKYRVRFETTKGPIVIEVTRAWAPLGADRFFNLVNIGFYDNVYFFRAIDGFMIQFGISGYAAVNTKWREARIQDDPVTQSNLPGMVTFATSGPNSRTTQLFINTGSNGRLDGMGFAPFGKGVEGMDGVSKLYTG